MLNLILFGPPNSGKGTQAQLLKEKYRLIHLSTGDLLRAERKAGTELGTRVQAIMDRGDLVSDEIILEMIDQQLVHHPDAGFLYDGFPRTKTQKAGLGLLLKRKSAQVDLVISLRVPEAELRKRVLQRAKEQGRADDKIEIFEKRMENYKTQTLPLAALYAADGVLKEVDGVGMVEEVFARIKSLLQVVI